jgi:hypothetical protein
MPTVEAGGYVVRQPRPTEPDEGTLTRSITDASYTRPLPRAAPSR